ncbi:MAG: ABC transporter permease [Bdellovibrionales bacterium]|nr:ABC transporter permease [Bdellovibrionales bacterium]
MTRYFLFRTALLIPTLLGISFVTFVLIHAAPGGPFEIALARLQRGAGIESQVNVSPAVISRLRNFYQLDKPITERYWQWLSKVATLRLGQSELYQAPVLEVVWARFLRSSKYAIWALPLCYLLAFIWSCLHLLRLKDAGQIMSSTLLAVLYCLPPLVLALALKYTLGSTSFVVVVIGYVLSHLAMMVLLFRGALLAEQGSEYARVAKSKGLSSAQVLLKHTLRNALIPIITSLSYSVVAFFSGALFLEVIFQIDGLGMLSYKAALARDYNLMMGIVLLVSSLFVIARWVSDILYGFADPRIRVSNE